MNRFFRFDPAIFPLCTTVDDPGAGGGSNSGGDGGGDNSKTIDNQNADARRAEVAQAVRDAMQSLLGKNGGDKDATLEELIKRNHGLEKQRDEAKANTLSKADREQFEKFKALNLSPDDVSRIVGEHKSWGEERTRNEKKQALKDAADLAGYNADLLSNLEGVLSHDFAVIGEGENRKAIVKIAGENGSSTEKALDAWVKEKWPSLENSLKASDSNVSANGKTFTQYGKTAPANSGKSGESVLSRIREKNAKTKGDEEKPSFRDRARRAGMTR